MNIEKTTIEIGLSKPFKVLHITDSHIPLCDERDSKEKYELAVRCGLLDGTKEANLKEQLEYAKKNCDLVVHTGDLTDFVSKANTDFARKTLSDDSIFYITGNHEFTQFQGEAWEDTAYRMNSYKSLGEGFGVNMFFNSRVFGGVNFVGIDDGYHQVEDWQTERLKMEAQKGFPIILCIHVPIFEQGLYDKVFSCNDSAYVLGCDEEHLLPYPEFRAMEQRPKDSTKRFIEYVYSEPKIKAVLAGHVHCSYESRLKSGIMQYATDGGFRNSVREILFK